MEMTKEDLFAVLMRVVGLVVFLYGLTYLLDALLLKLGYFYYGDSTPAYFLITGLGISLVGIYLLRGADILVRFAYPPAAEEETSEEPDS